MSDQPRPLPGQPSLRYLKLEARRRLAAGEFGTLHDAQLAIAREHGQSSWTALKELIESRLEALGHPALAQLRWVISRFGGADGPDWAAPADGELSEHFTDRFRSPELAGKMVRDLSRIAARLREELVVTQEDPLHARARAGGIAFEADAEAEPPHRLYGFRAYPVGGRVTDARVSAPPTSSSGAVPAVAAETAARGFAELGLAGVVLAGGAPGEAGWVIARGWADLDRAEPLRPGHRFPAYGVTRLITATAVLRLAAEGRFRLDDAANDHLRTVRLAGGAVTIRELLSYSGGVDNPAPGGAYVDTVPRWRRCSARCCRVHGSGIRGGRIPEYPRDFLPVDREPRGLLFRPGQILRQLLDPGGQPVRLGLGSRLPPPEFLDQRPHPQSPSPVHDGRRPQRRSTENQAKPQVRNPFRRAAPKGVSSYNAGRPRLGCAQSQPPYLAWPGALVGAGRSARRASTVGPGASRSSRTACYLSPGPGGPALVRLEPRLHALILTFGESPVHRTAFGLACAHACLSRKNIRR
jgi:beta-lactamase family protein